MSNPTIPELRAGLMLTAVIVGVLVGCSDDSSSGPDSEDLVGVSGVVANIDTGARSQGVVVSLLGAEDRYHSSPTGADGLFYLDLPRGSRFELVTNDFAGLDSDTLGNGRREANEWITLINVEPMIPSIDDDIEVLVHACPTPTSSQAWLGGSSNLGSVAIWQNFLQNSTTATDYTTATDVWGRTIGFLHGGTPPNMDAGVPVPQITGVALQIQEADFGRVGYWDRLTCFNRAYPGLEGVPVQDPGVGPDIFIKGALANGPVVSLASAFANATYMRDTVTVTLTDTDTGRNIDFSSINPVSLPLREGATTMLLLGSVDNQIAPLTEGFCAAGTSPTSCQ